MSEYPANQALAWARHMVQGEAHVFHFVPRSVNNSVKQFTWKPKQEVTLVNYSMFCAPQTSTNAYLNTVLDVETPDGITLQVFELMSKPVVTDTKSFVRNVEFGLTFPPDTEFVYDFSTFDTDNVEYWTWMNFRYKERLGNVPQPVRECGLLERFAHGGACDY